MSLTDLFSKRPDCADCGRRIRDELGPPRGRPIAGVDDWARIYSLSGLDQRAFEQLIDGLAIKRSSRPGYRRTVDPHRIQDSQRELGNKVQLAWGAIGLMIYEHSENLHKGPGFDRYPRWAYWMEIPPIDILCVECRVKAQASADLQSAARSQAIDEQMARRSAADARRRAELSVPPKTEGAQKRSRTIGPEVRREVWRRDQGRCVRCGSQDRLEFDHVIPFADDGSSTARNIELLCEDCNRKKSRGVAHPHD